MALEYVGGLASSKVGATSGNTTVNFSSLTGGSYSGGLQEGDLVLVVFGAGTAARTPSLLIQDPAASAYTLLGGAQVQADGMTYDAIMRVAYKVMGATPDTSLTVGPSGNGADGCAWAVHVWRNVDPTTPFDGVTPQTATGTGTSRPNPPSITPTTAGAKVIAACFGACSTGTTAFAFASSNNLVQANGADTNDGRASMASYDWTSGALDPAASTTGSNNAADSWAALTFVLKPYTAPPAGLTVTELTHKESTTTGDITTSSFTPADGSLLVAVSTLLAGPDTFWATNADTDDWLNQTITDSAGLTWTRRTGISADDNGDHNSWISEVVIWTAPVVTGAAMTVTFGESSGVSFGGERAGYIFQVTGHDTTSPIGAVGTDQGWNQASPSVTLGAAPASSSIVLGAIATDNDAASAGAITTGAGFTQVDEQQGQTWLSSQVQSREGSTSTSVPWTKTGLYTHAAAAIEIKAAPATTRPSLRSAISYSFDASAGSIDCPYPTGIVAGDALVAWVWTNQDQTLDVPAGWSRLGTQRNQVGTFAMSMFVRTATGGESGSVTFIVSNTPDYLGAAIAAVKDVDPTTPWQTTIGSASGASDASRSIPIPAVDNDNSFAITYSAGFETITGLPSAFTEEWVYDNMGQYYKDVDAGSATNASQSQANSNAWIAQTAVFIGAASSGSNVDFIGSLTETVAATLAKLKIGAKAVSLTETVTPTLSKAKAASRSVSLTETVTPTLAYAKGSSATPSATETVQATLSSVAVRLRADTLAEAGALALAYAPGHAGTASTSSTGSGTAEQSTLRNASVTVAGSGVLDDVTSGLHFGTEDIAETVQATLSATPVHGKAVSITETGGATASTLRTGLRALTFAGTENLSLSYAPAHAHTGAITETGGIALFVSRIAQAATVCATTGATEAAVEGLREGAIAITETGAFDAVSAKDTQATLTLAETVTHTLFFTSNNGFFGDLSETVGFDAVFTPGRLKAVSITEAMSAALSYEGMHSRTLSVSETGQTTAATRRDALRAVSLTDTAQATEAHAGLRSQSASIAETVQGTLAYAEVDLFTGSITESAALTVVTVANRMSAVQVDGAGDAVSGGQSTLRPRAVEIAEAGAGAATGRKIAFGTVEILEEVQGSAVVDTFTGIRYTVRQVVLGEPTYVLVDGEPARTTVSGKPHRFTLKGYPD